MTSPDMMLAVCKTEIMDYAIHDIFHFYYRHILGLKYFDLYTKLPVLVD